MNLSFFVVEFNGRFRNNNRSIPVIDFQGGLLVSQALEDP